MTRRIPLENPAATNRLIRWIYDGWRGEIGSWPRVNLARVKTGENGSGEKGGGNGAREQAKEGCQIDSLQDLCHYFLPGSLRRRRRTLGDGTRVISRRAVFHRLARHLHFAALFAGEYSPCRAILMRQRTPPKVLINSRR